MFRICMPGTAAAAATRPGNAFCKSALSANSCSVTVAPMRTPFALFVIPPNSFTPLMSTSRFGVTT
jgi:hypothetical protein